MIFAGGSLHFGGPAARAASSLEATPLRHPSAATLLVLGLLALAAPVRAAGPEVWRSQCLGDEGLGSEICTTEITTSDGARDYVVYFVRNEGGRNPLVVAGEEGRFTATTIRVDDREPIDADRCELELCYFELDKSAVLLQQFRKGGSARITVTAEGEGIVLDRSITLRGFTAAYARGGP